MLLLKLILSAALLVSQKQFVLRALVVIFYVNIKKMQILVLVF